ncbi:hypothetical protein FB45DRAFT_872283 [Roridomyces roridus]|uniref:F-box domain-containing protein n=1 Tax=Roridomyces roridus TaxID=1738132 RepID=A0AAD7FFT7_9AGAR|nr:hypothetical protein FB45DRAFT_872283 [Roridomyces roridus]
MTSDDETLPKLSNELDALRISPAAEPSPISSLFPEILCQIFILALPPIEGHISLDNRLPPPGRHTTRKKGVWQLGPRGLSPRSAPIGVLSPSHTDPYGAPSSSTRLCSTGRCDQILWVGGQLRGFGDKVKIIVAHRARWPSLWIECDSGSSPPDEFMNSKLGTLPMLRHLTLNGRLGSRLDQRFYSMLSDAPNLQSVALRSPGRLLAATQLVECDLDFDDAELLRVDFGVVNLPHLRRLVVTNTKFLPHLVAPSLQELQVHGLVDHVASFLQSSFCILTGLTLFMCTSPASQIIALLQVASSITVLELDFIGPEVSEIEGAVLVSALAVGTDDNLPVQPICPRLVSLSWGDRNDVLPRQAFAAMIESRWRLLEPPGQLRSLGLYLGRKRVGWRLRCLAQEGLKVVWGNQRTGRQAMKRWRE